MTEKLRNRARLVAATVATMALVAVVLLGAASASSASTHTSQPNPLLVPTNLTVGEGGTADQGQVSWTPPPIVTNGSATYDGRTMYPFAYVAEYWSNEPPEYWTGEPKEADRKGTVMRIYKSHGSLHSHPSASLSFLKPGEWCARAFVLISPSNTQFRVDDLEEGDRSDEVCFTMEAIDEPADMMPDDTPTLIPVYDPGTGETRYQMKATEPPGKENFKTCTIEDLFCNSPAAEPAEKPEPRPYCSRTSRKDYSPWCPAQNA